jgi:hypothetical protein
MDLLSFLGALEAVPPDMARHLVRDKIALARRYGLVFDCEPDLPDDVARTRIPDSALDGYMASRFLVDPTLGEGAFAHYAFSCAALFAANEMALRAGVVARRFQREYSFFLTRSLSPWWTRVIAALDYAPLVFALWADDLSRPPFAQNDILPVLKTMLAREAQSGVEQCVQLINIARDRPTVLEGRLADVRKRGVVAEGKIGLLTVGLLDDVDDYLLAFDRLRPRFSPCVTLLVYDRRPVVEACLSRLLAMDSRWRGVALKVLAYERPMGDAPYALAALRAELAMPWEPS